MERVVVTIFHIIHFFSVIMDFVLEFRVFHVNFVLCNRRYSPFNFLNYFLLDIFACGYLRREPLISQQMVAMTTNSR